MKALDFIKLILKHKVILILVPLLFGVLAIILTMNPKNTYYSETILYTGIASGSSIEMDKQFNYLAANNAFDNLINTITSRDTQEEVAIRLLSQHLMLKEPNPKFISEDAFEKLHGIVPSEIEAYFSTHNHIDYEEAVAYLIDFKNKDNSNFVYSLLSFDYPYYSLEAISDVNVERISSSDLVKLSYKTDDPGICQQTLKIYNEVCIKKYKYLKENGSDVVVNYFETQLKQSEIKLKGIEQKLLKFNQDNNIINYYEQSKAIAIVKEEMDVAYNKGLAQLAGTEASSKRLEEKLEIQEAIQQKNNAIVDSKKDLGNINYRIGILMAKSNGDETSLQQIEGLKQQAKQIQIDIKENVDELYSFQNSIDGVPIKKVLPDWVDTQVETEDLKAKLTVMDAQNEAFEKEFANYAPAGANLKKIEREIDVAEQEYLEILHGLNLAKLKFQDTQLSSNLTAVDQPFFPLRPIPSKRKLLIIAVVIIAAFILLATILLMEFFDDTLKNEERAQKKLGLVPLGMLPKLFISKPGLNLIKIQNRLMDFVLQNINMSIKQHNHSSGPKIITVLSTRPNEGKTAVCSNIAKCFKVLGNRIVVFNHGSSKTEHVSSSKLAFLYRCLGYQDPRIDYNHPFLSAPETHLTPEEYKLIGNMLDLDIEDLKNTYRDLDYILIELPNLLEYPYPPNLLLNSDLAILVCRSNRLWTKADNNILNAVKQLASQHLKFILNGVEVKEVETILGELTYKQSITSLKLKDVFRLQFYSSNRI